ncbi:MAG: thiamine pyrophosphate-dependent enzyme [Pseudomonadota bacterium]
MPKQIAVDPNLLAEPGEVAFAPIPIRQYRLALADERERRGDAALINMLRHMLIVREFESMLASFKATGKYGSADYVYKGPAHLSIGQEAAAVGSAFALEPRDLIFGSHRSHGEFIAKTLSALGRLDAAAIDNIMAETQSGVLRDAAASAVGEEDLAENFVLLGLLAEIFMKSNGFNGGMGGSMHAFFPPLGAYPNNAIVGASAGIAAGAALFQKRLSEDTICVSHTGDGSLGCGPVWEAMNFAAMAQFETLWEAKRPGGLPVLFQFTNNFYAMGGQTIGETMGWERLSRVGAAINPASMHAETVDGTNVLAVADAVERQRDRLIAGEGPALLDVECYRSCGHSTSDTNAYRSRDELKVWEAHDPIVLFAECLTSGGVLSASAVESMKAEVADKMERVVHAAIDPSISAAADISSKPALIGGLMFSGTEIRVPDQLASLTNPTEKAAPVRQIARKSRFGLDENGEQISPMRAVTLRDGLFESILHHMTHDERLIAYGEECREWGGAFGVYRGLADILPHERLFNSPISEAAIVATAVGYAMAGGRALVELMYGDFIGRAGDEIFNQMSKWQAMSGGMIDLPVVLRCSIGSKYGAQHSQDWSSMVAHVPGLKLVYPATPTDAKGLMASALSSNDPVIVFESQRLYDRVEEFETKGVPQHYFRTPLGEPDIKRAGDDLTILTIGPSLYPAIEAANELSEAFDVETEIIDARTLVPFNYDAVLASVRKTGHLLIVSEASERGSFAQTLASTVTRHAFGDLKAPPRVLGSPNWIVPGADMEETYFPQARDIIDAVATDFFPHLKPNRSVFRNWNDLDLARQGI